MVWTYKFKLSIKDKGSRVDLNMEIEHKDYIHIDASKDSHQGILLALYHKDRDMLYMEEMLPRRVMVDMRSNIVFVDLQAISLINFGPYIGLKEAATSMEQNTDWVWDGVKRPMI